MADTARLSVVILTFNEESNLPDCLASLRGLDCERFVVDSFSTDATVEIANAGGARVVEHVFENYAAQRNWAQKNLPLASPWVLHLDADERLTPELVEEINRITAAPPGEIRGYMLRKRTVFMGRWIRHGGHYPSFHLRLFDRMLGQCEDRLYDQHYVVSGPVAQLRHDYVDVVSSSLATWSARHVRWATLEAAEMAASQSTGQVSSEYFGNPIERRRWWRRTYSSWPLFVRPLCYWVFRYLFRFGFLDGKEGLIFHFLQGFWFRFLVDAMIFEARQGRNIP